MTTKELFAEVSSRLWLVVVATICIWIAGRLYSAFLGPLSNYPGPLANKLSIIPYSRAMWNGDEAATLRDWHNEYGPVVRISPQGLSYIGSADAWRDIYGISGKADRPGLGKDRVFYNKNAVRSPGLLMASDEEHRRQRRILGPAFSEKAIREQEVVLKRWAEGLYYKLNTLAEAGGDVDMVKMFNYTTFDVMADLCFAEPLYMLENATYTPWAQGVFKGLKSTCFIRAIRQVHPLVQFVLEEVLVKLPAMRVKEKQHYKYTSDRVDRRIASTPSRPDLWTHILSKADDPADNLSLKAQYANAGVFMIAGTETSSTALSATLFYMLSNSSKMSRACQEVRSGFKTIDALQIGLLGTQCPYLTACLQEGIRLHPPVPIGMPRCTAPEGAMIAGDFVPGGVSVSIPQLATYRSADCWKDANKFVPERWLNGNTEYQDDNRDGFEPFSHGPRNCIGKNLAWHEMRLLLATVLLNFDVELCAESKQWADQKVFTVWERKPLIVKLRPRSQSPWDTKNQTGS